MKCVDVENYLSDYVADELDSFTVRKIELHSKGCILCCKKASDLKNTNKLLKNLPPVFPSHKLDEWMMQSFRKHQQEKQKPAFWTAIFASFSISKPALALGLLALILFTGAAFQLGKMTSPNQTLSQSAQTNEPNQIVKIIEKRVEVPVIKTIEVPIYKEKIVNQIIYRNRVAPQKPRTRNEDKLIFSDLQSNTATFIQTSDESFTPINLKNFQPISEIKVSIIKNGERNEK